MQDLVNILPILGIFLVFWLLIIRPASRRQKALKEVQRGITVGDHVITGAGMFGIVTSDDGDRFGLEIADGVVIAVARSSVVGLVDDEVFETEDAEDAEHTESTESTEGVEESAPAEEPATPADPDAPSTHKEL